MPEIAMRKHILIVEEIFHEGGPPAKTPLKRGAVMDDLKPLGLQQMGAAGELEHGAHWHVPGGYAMREILGGAKAIVPSTKKVTHINASNVRSHFDTMEIGVADGPKADEVLLALVMTTGPLIHARVGGLKASEAKGEDGLR